MSRFDLGAPLRVFLHFSDLWSMAHRRLLYEPALALALLAGWLSAVALVSAIPMYTDAVNQALLRNQLQATQNNHRPAFAFLFHYAATGRREARLDQYQALAGYMQTSLDRDLRLPAQVGMHYVKSDLFQLFPTEGDSYRRTNQPLSRLSLGFIAGMDQHTVLLEGSMPAEGWQPGQPIEVLASQSLAEELGLQTGEVYALFRPSSSSALGSQSAFTANARVTGIWQAQAPQAPFWYIPPNAFDDVLLLPQAAYLELASGHIPQPIFDAGWYRVFDGGAVRAENVAGFQRHVATVESRIAALLPGTRLSLSPLSALQRYQKTAAAQSLLLLLLGLPVIGLVLLFIALVARNMVERQRQEIALLKSRGSSRSQIAATYLLQNLSLSVVALALGIPLGWLAANGMGSTRQFLVFERALPLSIAVTQESLRFAGVAILLALAVTLEPALRAARLTIVAAKQQISRPPARVWARSLPADFLLFAATAYGAYLLLEQGRIAFLAWGQPAENSVGAQYQPWNNPLLFLVPTLFLLSGARLYLQLLPLALRAAEWTVARLPGLTVLLAMRTLVRNIHHYGLLFSLLFLTTGLGTFLTSVARTLDDNLVASTYYRNGANVVLVEAAGRTSGGPLSVAQPADAGDAGLDSDAASGWAILPVSEHTQVPGVQAVTRIGVFPTNVRANAQAVPAQLYGIDRVDFPSVAFFRRDFAPRSLGELMNALGLEFSGILVRQEFLDLTGLQIGDSIELRGLVAGSSQVVRFLIVGALDLFPTAYPGQGEFFIANLEYIFMQLGGPVPYYVWLDVAEDLDGATLVGELEKVGFTVLKVQDTRQQIAEARAKPERIGLFGFLSLGFVVTIFLSILALSTHAFLMYQRRFIQMGIMRAIGLSSWQVAGALACEQILVTLLALLGGAAIGLLSSRIFIPTMQIGYTELDLIPPFVVIVAWHDVARAVGALVLTTLAVTAGVAWLLSRLRLFQAIKMGEILG